MRKTNKMHPKDHIFGDMDQPQKSVKWLIKRYQGVHHYHAVEPEHPKPGEKIKIMATTCGECPYHSLTLWYTIDEWKTAFEVPLLKKSIHWNSILWNYETSWSVYLPPQPEGTMLRYRIAARCEGIDEWIYADTQSDEPGKGSDYAIWFSNIVLPDWARHANVYQVFVDRFNPGEGQKWFQETHLMDYFGGTLQGVCENLEYIKYMGFNTLWLTPVLDSPTHHGYDIKDYYEINERFGDNDDFKYLIQKAHSLGIRIIMDLVLNHCSDQHPFFVDALHDPDSPYHDWFVWQNWPEYECFYDVPTMPKVNLKYGSPARRYFLDVAQYWLEFGVDGFRLDYANGPEQDFWVDFRRACEQTKKDVWTFGEVIAPPDVQKTFANGLNGTLDFLLCQALRMTFAQNAWPLSKFASFIETHFSFFSHDFSMPSFIDNHDMNRFLFAANNDTRALKVALLTLYVLPGPPIIYYGTEAELSQYHSIHEKGAMGFDEARLAMLWQENNISGLTFYIRKLSEIRAKNNEIFQNQWLVDQYDDERQTLVFRKENDHYFLIINRGETKQEFRVAKCKRGHYKNLIENEDFNCKNGLMRISVNPVSAKLLKFERE